MRVSTPFAVSFTGISPVIADRGTPRDAGLPSANVRQTITLEGAGFTAGVPWRQPQADYPVKNVAAQEGDPGSLLSTYRELVHLHVGTPALASGDFTALAASNSSVAAFLRQSGDDRALVLINFDSAAVEGLTLDLEASGLPQGEYRLEPIYGAPAAEIAPLSLRGTSPRRARRAPGSPRESPIRSRPGCRCRRETGSGLRASPRL